jgi:hypothetical protein
VYAPDLLDHLACLFDSVRRGSVRSALERLASWQRTSRGAAEPSPAAAEELPEPPFVAVLLQRPDDPRLRLDVSDPPTPAALAVAARAAAVGIDARLPVLLVTPPGGVDLDELRGRERGFLVAPASAAVPAVVAAAAVVTVNHPLGMLGVLAGTPVLHLGTSLWGVPGVAHRTRQDTLREDLPRALAEDHPTLRARCVSHLLARDHLWCAPDAADANGLRGLVTELECRLQRAAPQAAEPLRYRPGPVWPLRAE